MHWLESILGLPDGFLQQPGKLRIQFNPVWPWQNIIDAATWNLTVLIAAALLLIYVARRERRAPAMRIVLTALRAMLFLWVLVLLNRPLMTLSQIHREPSVLAILLDDSLSMKVPDQSLSQSPPSSTQPTAPEPRLKAAVDLLTQNNAALLHQLAAVHTIRIYAFSDQSRALTEIPGPDAQTETAPDITNDPVTSAASILQSLAPQGASTHVVSAVQTVLGDLQGQHIAGVAIFTDGRETPAAASASDFAAVRAAAAPLMPIAVGSDREPKNLAVDSVSYEPSAYVDDLANFRVRIRATGYEPNHPLNLTLLRQIKLKNGQISYEPLLDDQHRPITKSAVAPNNSPFDVDLQYKPTQTDIPSTSLAVRIDPQPGEVDDADNQRAIPLAVLDDNISVLYVDGYPRWDYRYLKTALLRDHSIKLSCLLTSADPTFAQEGSVDPNHAGGSWAITAFPNTLDQLLDYDVILLGDVDPRQFTDAQLQLISDFVSQKGGGFEMVAGPRYSPQSYRGTPIESVLPVVITPAAAEDYSAAITQTFRPVLTAAGLESSIFRFFPDREVNLEYMQNHLPGLFWFSRGLIAKTGVGIVLAEHPTDLAPDGHKAPILVAGRFGSGATLFSAIDDSWRWRFYTGESIFNTYWVQQLRFLARSRKLGQRQLTFTADQPVYDLGQQITFAVHLLSADLQQQTAGPLIARLDDDATGQTLQNISLTRSSTDNSLFVGSLSAERLGNFTAHLQGISLAAPTAAGSTPAAQPSVMFRIESPQLELSRPQVDTASLSRLGGSAVIPFSQAAAKLSAIPSAAVAISLLTSQPLYTAPLAMIVFVILICVEWVLRKWTGLL